MSSVLKVNTIRHTNGTSGMTIDSSGRVFQPTKPSFNAHRNSGGDIAANTGSSGVVIFNSTTVNIGNGFDTSTGKFTAPVAGTYFFSTSCLTTATNSATDLQIRVDDVRVAQGRADAHSALQNSIFISVIATLTASQVVHVHINIGGGIYGSTGEYNTFCGYLIG